MLASKAATIGARFLVGMIKVKLRAMLPNAKAKCPAVVRNSDVVIPINPGDNL
jgi:hypothetical protein